MALIVYGSLYPWQFEAPQAPLNPLITLIYSWKFHLTRTTLRDTFINVLLYVPLGIAARLSLQKSYSFFAQIAIPVALGLFLSSSIEMAQLYTSNRHCSMADVVTNVIGTLIGAASAAAAGKTLRDFPVRRWMKQPGAIMLLCCWMAYVLFPFFPVFGRAALKRKLQIFIAAPLFDPPTLVSSAAVLFIIAAVLTLIGLRRNMAMSISAAAVPVQFLIASRTPVPSEFIGAAAGCGVLVVTPERHRKGIALVLIGLATVIRGLAPFHLTSEPLAFSWVPFESVLQGQWQYAASILVEKVFFYGALIWCLQWNGRALLRSTLITAVLLAVIETVQIYLPGRTPEITDPVLAIFIGYIMYVARRNILQAG